MTTHPQPGHCQQCGMPGLVYEHENEPSWLCDECTALTEMDAEQDEILRRERRRDGHAGHNDRNVDYRSLDIPTSSTSGAVEEWPRSSYGTP